MDDLNPENYSFFDLDVQREPFAFYKALRKTAPVFKSDELNCYVVSRNTLIRDVLADHETFSNIDANSGFIINQEVAEEIRALRAKGYPQVPFLATNDPPTHTVYRKIFSEVLSRASMTALQPSIDELVEQLLAPMLTRGGGNFVGEFAELLPIMVIARMLGAPMERVADYKAWNDAYAAPLSGMLSPERELECAQLTLDYQQFFEAELEQRRIEPRDDVLTQLVQFEVPGENRLLDMPELLAAVQQLVVAGGETTTFTLGNGLLMLIQDPALLARVREDTNNLRVFIEEVLRLQSPSQGLYRIVLKDTEIGGVPIPKGSVVNVRIGAGNRDEAAFDAPDQLDLKRRAPTRHLSFGVGLHFCMGAQLARAELMTTFQRLLSHVQHLSLDEDAGGYDYFPSVFFHGLEKLHVKFA